MTGKRFYIVWWLGLALFITSCGNDAPPDAVITAVEGDRTTTIGLGGGGAILIDGAIHFKVTASSDDTTPVSNATVEISGSSPSIGDPNAGFVAGSGTPPLPFVNAITPNHIVLTTAANGVVTAYYQYTIPACGGATADLTVSANISASIGGSTGEWKNEITVKCS